MLEYIYVSAGTATSNNVKKSSLLPHAAIPGTISSSAQGNVLDTIFLLETSEEREDRKWEETFNSPRGLQTLDFLLAEARREIDAGEFKESGFGLE